MDDLDSALDPALTSSSSVHKARLFYETCMNRRQQEQQGLEPLTKVYDVTYASPKSIDILLAYFIDRFKRRLLPFLSINNALKDLDLH